MNAKQFYKKLDFLWDCFERDFESGEFHKYHTVRQWMDSVLPEHRNFYHLASSFKFEISVYYKRPIRNTVKWVDGNHAFLFNNYGCKAHRVIVALRDDWRMIDGQLPACPLCNDDNIYTKYRGEKFPLYWWRVEFPSDGKVDEWDEIEAQARRRRRKIVLSNLLWRLKNPHYTLYLIKKKLKLV